MKKLTLLAAIGLSSFLALFAQQEGTQGAPPHQMQGCSKKDCCKRDCCTMQNGKMMCMANGKMTPMEKDMIMTDSTTVKTDGTVIKKNGETMKMKEGMCCDMMGNMHESCPQHKKMKKGKGGGAYTCPMHPDATSGKPGNCPRCGMPMTKP